MKAVISQTNKTKTNKESFAVNLVTVVAGCIAGIFADYALTQAQIQLFASPSVNLFFSGGGLKLFVFWGALFVRGFLGKDGYSPQA
ncbi:hypothetical protein QS257_20435 [Terrilactibacillus sp. S3-3]|nr:hypothetical protein QS257_20435 [Terrilactibacillus sp. S3-3]